MMIASCGSSIKPIESILRQTSPEQLLLFTYKSTETTEILKDLSKILNNCKIFIETIEIPKNPDSDWWHGLHQEIQEQITSYDPKFGGEIWLNGGTPWLSHTLHHVAILLGMDVNVATIKKIEGREVLFFHFTNPLKTQRLATQLDSLSGPRKEILRLLKKNRVLTIPELSEYLEVQNEAIRFMLEGRRNRSKDGEELVYKGLRAAGLVEHAEDQHTGKKGRPTYRYKITQLGLQTLSNLNLQL